MTTVIIKKRKDATYSEFCCMGHAEYAEEGTPDILCAAISALTHSCVNALEELAGEPIVYTTNEETGFLRCVFPDILQEKSVFLIDTMVFSLENLVKEYGTEYLQVKFEEV